MAGIKQLSTSTYLDKIWSLISSYAIKTSSKKGTISKDMLLEMLELEEKVRMSKFYINECTRIKDEINGWLRLSGEIQNKIASKFGFNDPLTNYIAVNNMRRAHITFPNDSRFREVSVYVRNNLARKGNLKIGDSFIDAKLTSLDKRSTNLDKLVSNNKYNLIIASSET